MNGCAVKHDTSPEQTGRGSESAVGVVGGGVLHTSVHAVQRAVTHTAMSSRSTTIVY